MSLLEPIIRVAEECDGPAVAEIYGPYVRETAVSFEVEPPTAATMAQRIIRTLETHPWLVADCGMRLLATPTRASIANGLPIAGPSRLPSTWPVRCAEAGSGAPSICRCWRCYDGRASDRPSRRSFCRTPAASDFMRGQGSSPLASTTTSVSSLGAGTTSVIGVAV